MIIDVNIDVPIRNGLTPNELWKQSDKGIIKAWELGREWAKLYPKMSSDAKSGCLLELKRATGTKGDEENYIRLFKGGYNKRQTQIYKYGTLHYYAMWLGLRGDNLKVDMEIEYPLVCSRTRMGVVYTIDSKKYLSIDIPNNELYKYEEAFASIL